VRGRPADPDDNGVPKEVFVRLFTAGDECQPTVDLEIAYTNGIAPPGSGRGVR